MLSDALLEAMGVIDALREKIEQFRPNLSESEALVRYSLIDPFLRLIGWNTEDPAQVRPEYSTESGRSDYALLDETGDIAAFVGAKKLGKTENLVQHIAYCISDGADRFITSDGDKWEVYDLNKKGDIHNRKVLEWQISRDEPAEIVRRALFIGNFSFFGTDNEVAFAKKNTQIRVKKEVVDNRAFVDDAENNRSPVRPKSMVIMGSPLQVRYAKDILVNAAEWLIKQGNLKLSDLPIATGPIRYLISENPKHINGHGFYLKQKLSNGAYIETHASHDRIEFLARFLMKKYGYDENSIEVEWENQT